MRIGAARSLLGVVAVRRRPPGSAGSGTVVQRRERWARVALLLALPASLTLFAAAAPAHAVAPVDPGVRAEQRLSERYAPVLHLVDQVEACGAGEPFQPSDVDALLGKNSVALRARGPSHDLIEVAPTAEDLSQGLDGYALDFPGDPLKPDCSYEKWADEVFDGTPVTVYAHVAKVAMLVVFGAALTTLVGGLLGTGLILVAQACFVVANLLPGVVSALLGPFVSLTFAYAYFHGLVVEEERGAAPEEHLEAIANHG